MNLNDYVICNGTHQFIPTQIDYSYSYYPNYGNRITFTINDIPNFRTTIPCHLEIDKVIFNAPATIVFWSDGTKTVVKADNEPFDKEKGLALAIAKKALGNKGNYYNVFKKFINQERKG